MFETLFRLLTHDLGIDLGTANTLIYVRGKGIMIREPSVVACRKKSKEIVAVGSEAKKMIGKTPEEIEVTRPLRDGVIADFDAALGMLSFYIKEIHKSPGIIPKIPRPKVVIGIPTGVTEVERRAVQDAALSAGAREAVLIEEPIAAAIGAGLPFEAPEGQFLIDIGGGTTEVAVISLGGIVIDRCLRVAGDEMDETIINFARLKHNLLLGPATAEEIKVSIGSAATLKKERQIVVRGRDLGTGLPRSLKLNSTEIREAISSVLQEIIGSIKETLEETPPELVSDILERGLILSGGVALLPGIDQVISEATRMPCWIADEPLTCVVRGCGKVLEDKKLQAKVRVVRGLK